MRQEARDSTAAEAHEAHLNAASRAAKPDLQAEPQPQSMMSWIGSMLRSLMILESEEDRVFQKDELIGKYDFRFGKHKVMLKHGSLSSGTGARPWVGGAVLAQYLAEDPDLQRVAAALSGWEARPQQGARVVELGAGVGIVSLAAFLNGARVCATDGDEDLLPVISDNITSNATRLASSSAADTVADPSTLKVLQCRWSNEADMQAVIDALDGIPEVIVAADVVYGRTDEFFRAHMQLVETLVILACAGASKETMRGSALFLFSMTRRYDGDTTPFWKRFEQFFEYVEVDTTGMDIEQHLSPAHMDTTDPTRSRIAVYAGILKPEFFSKATADIHGGEP